jgi:hypothetical protein
MEDDQLDIYSRELANLHGSSVEEQADESNAKGSYENILIQKTSDLKPLIFGIIDDQIN